MASESAYLLGDRHTVTQTCLHTCTVFTCASSFIRNLSSSCGSHLLTRMPPSTVYKRLNYQSHKLCHNWCITNIYYVNEFKVHVLIFTLQEVNVGLVYSLRCLLFFSFGKKFNAECAVYN